jgi:hypothetical protein
LSAADLASVAQQAVTLWAASGLTPAQLALLEAVQYQIAPLDGGALGLTELGGTLVTLDATAAGYGWFLDPTPANDSEFGFTATPQELWAGPDSPAFGRMDLLTVVEHELGHVLGAGDLDPQAVPHDLLTETLATGVRRLPTPMVQIANSATETPAAPAALAVALVDSLAATHPAPAVVELMLVPMPLDPVVTWLAPMIEVRDEGTTGDGFASPLTALIDPPPAPFDQPTVLGPLVLDKTTDAAYEIFPWPDPCELA